jgi:hypothetical protein
MSRQCSKERLQRVHEGGSRLLEALVEMFLDAVERESEVGENELIGTTPNDCDVEHVLVRQLEGMKDRDKKREPILAP